VTRTASQPAASAKVRITDSTLRDGSHAMAHRFTEEQVRGVVHALDAAGVEVIEVSHGDGLGGSSFNYGFSAVDDVKLVAAAADEARDAKIAVLLLPGVGTIHDLKLARDAGAAVARIATHCTEADVSLQHFAAAREMGMETVGFLMLAHRIGPEELARQARIMVDGGAECVYVVDSGFPPASTSRLPSPPPRTSLSRSCTGCRSPIGARSPRVTPTSTPASCCTPSAPRSATASRRTRSFSASARPATSAARKT
jgi:HMGL-like